MSSRTPLRSVAGLGTLLLLGLACSSATDNDIVVPAHDVAIVLGASSKAAAAFSPSPFTVSLGTTGKVTWANADFTNNGYGGSSGTTHHLISDTGVFDLGTMGPGAAKSFTFTGTGSFAYHCTIHPTMVGTVTVTN